MFLSILLGCRIAVILGKLTAQFDVFEKEGCFTAEKFRAGWKSAAYEIAILTMLLMAVAVIFSAFAAQSIS